MAGQPIKRARKALGLEKPPAGGPANGAGIGGPASGSTGENIPQGTGWGGPANGAGLPPDEWTNRPQPRDPETIAERKAMRAARSREAEDALYAIFKDTEQPGGNRINAAAKLHEIYNGRPVERVIVDEQPIVTDTLDPEDLSPETRDELREALERHRDEQGTPPRVH